MYILLKTDNPQNINILNKGDTAHYFYANDLNEAKLYLDELEDTDNKKYWLKYCANPNMTCCKEFSEYLRQTVLSSNKLSAENIEELCKEFYYWLPEKPKVSPWHAHKTDKNLPAIFIDKEPVYNVQSCIMLYGFRGYWIQLFNIVDRYTQTKHNIHPWGYKDYDFNPVQDLGIIFNKKMDFLYYKSACGALNMQFYKLIYYFDYLKIPISDNKLKDFWKFYKKTMDVYSIGLYSDPYNRSVLGICVSTKPDEIFIKDNITHIYHKDKYYCDGIKVSKKIYQANKGDLDINRFSKIKNVDTRTIYIKKIGIEKFIEQGKIIDSYENYPENEWWIKSEYKLIDMGKIVPPIKIIYARPRIGMSYTKIRYAPFLCMKNQTTGEYHLEGVNPDCRNLYDALKMRYKMLNLPEYEIKDIK